MLINKTVDNGIRYFFLSVTRLINCKYVESSREREISIPAFEEAERFLLQHCTGLLTSVSRGQIQSGTGAERSYSHQQLKVGILSSEKRLKMLVLSSLVKEKAERGTSLCKFVHSLSSLRFLNQKIHFTQNHKVENVPA